MHQRVDDTEHYHTDNTLYNLVDDLPNQNEYNINVVYNKWCNTILNEMSIHFKTKSIKQGDTIRSSKPYWNVNLTALYIETNQI